jgi:hypothetical protein
MPRWLGCPLSRFLLLWRNLTKALAQNNFCLKNLISKYPLVAQFDMVEAS